MTEMDYNKEFEEIQKLILKNLENIKKYMKENNHMRAEELLDIEINALRSDLEIKELSTDSKSNR